jgi:hypothetical protein
MLACMILRPMPRCSLAALAAVTLALALTAPARAGAPDSTADGTAPAAPAVLSRRLWADPAFQGGPLATDKFLHATATFNAAVDLRLAGASPAASLLGAAAVGLLKEFRDWRRPPGPSQGAGALDLAADAAGITLAALLIGLCAR